MYTLVQRALPALGKEADVRAQLTDWAKYSQSKGRNIALSAQLFSSDGPALITTTLADDLNTLERYRHENLGDADWQARVARLLPLLRGPVAAIVSETLIPPGGSGPVGIVSRAVGFPALGKEREFRSITEDFVKASQAAGVRMGMGVRIFSPIGPAFQVTAVYPDLAALDKSRQERLSATREVVQAIHRISREPIRQRVYEVLVPLLPN
jgi:hypothetical protein